MKMQRLLIILTVANLALMVFTLAKDRRVEAQGIADVLRGHALEIADNQGRVRTQITMNPETVIAGTRYPENVPFRLIDPKARPVVKIEGSQEGGGLFFGGESEPTMVQLGAKGATSR